MKKKKKEKQSNNNHSQSNVTSLFYIHLYKPDKRAVSKTCDIEKFQVYSPVASSLEFHVRLLHFRSFGMICTRIIKIVNCHELIKIIRTHQSQLK